MGWPGSAWRVLLIKTSLIVILYKQTGSLSDQPTNNFINYVQPTAPRHLDVYLLFALLSLLDTDSTDPYITESLLDCYVILPNFDNQTREVED